MPAVDAVDGNPVSGEAATGDTIASRTGTDTTVSGKTGVAFYILIQKMNHWRQTAYQRRSLSYSCFRNKILKHLEKKF